MRKIFLIIMLLGVTQAALADLPLIVKGLITDQDKYKVNFSLGYSNAENRDLSGTSNRITAFVQSLRLMSRQAI